MLFDQRGARLNGSSFLSVSKRPFPRPNVSNYAPIFEGELEQAVTAVQLEFEADMGTMRFDRARADEQFCCDLPAGLVLSDKLENAPLRFRQVVEARLLRREFLGSPAPAHEVARDRWTQVMLPRRDCRKTVQD